MNGRLYATVVRGERTSILLQEEMRGGVRRKAALLGCSKAVCTMCREGVMIAMFEGKDYVGDLVADEVAIEEMDGTVKRMKAEKQRKQEVQA